MPTHFPSMNYIADLFIDGEWRAGSEGKTFGVSDPSDGSTIAQFAIATEVDCDADKSTEIFGPVTAIVKVDDVEEMIRMANDSIFGLIGYVSGEEALALRTALKIDAGMVGVNRGVLSDPAAPFGGTKQSGLGREGSSEGILEYLEEKYIGMTP